MSRIAGLVIVALTSALLVGCGGSHEPSAKPSYAGTTAACVVSDAQGEMIVNPGSMAAAAPLRLDQASLVKAVNLKIIESDVVRFTGNPTIQGVIWNYPPLKNAGLADSLADWDERTPLAGHVLRPKDGRQAILVALRLIDPTKNGHLNGVRLEDSAGKKEYVQAVLVKPPGKTCTLADYAGSTSWAPAP